MKQPIDPVTFIKRLLTKNELGQPFKLMPFQETVINCAFAFDADGKLPWDTIVYSTIKKGGKSAINAILTLWGSPHLGSAERALLFGKRSRAIFKPHLRCHGRADSVQSGISR